MCGIFISVHHSPPDGRNIPGFIDVNNFERVCQDLKEANATRGPDAQNSHLICINPLNCNRSCVASNDVSSIDTSTSLNLEVELYVSELHLRGNVLVTQPHVRDGNVLCWNGEIFDGLEVLPENNDGSKLIDALCSITDPEQVQELVGRIEGPYAFVFYHASSQHLYFARDPLGRRSLLIHKPSQELPYFLLTSVTAGVSPNYNFEELGTNFIYSLDLGALCKTQIVHVPNTFSMILRALPRTVPKHGSHNCQPYAQLQAVNRIVPPDNTSRLTSFDNIPDYLVKAMDDLEHQLDRSVMLRVCNIPGSSGQVRLGILFSGGIDSAVIALLAHRHVPIEDPIDLLNVAFENPRKIRIQTEGNTEGRSKREKRERIHSPQTPNQNSKMNYMVPDRITGLSEVEELRLLCPGRIWNFVEIDIPYEESQESRQIVESLMFPGRTVMDFSLAQALYFAARGIGKVRKSPGCDPQPYSSTARVLLNGLGSDELLGGYGRHRSSFIAGGWQAVINELQLEIDRIPTRNLGRDDRIISSHGKETRHPFLSLSVVSFLASLPVDFKLDPRLEAGFGDKLLLRLLARRLGLLEASTRKKRAMQFGSHSAGMEGEKRGDALFE